MISISKIVVYFIQIFILLFVLQYLGYLSYKNLPFVLIAGVILFVLIENFKILIFPYYMFLDKYDDFYGYEYFMSEKDRKRLKERKRSVEPQLRTLEEPPDVNMLNWWYGPSYNGYPGYFDSFVGKETKPMTAEEESVKLGYKLKDGSYSAKIIQPGYNPRQVKAYNQFM